MFLLRLILTVVALCGLHGEVEAQAPAGWERAGDVVYQAPPGWQRFEKDGVIFYLPPDAGQDQGACFIAILPGTQLQGDFRAWFDAAVAIAQKGSTVVSGGEVATARASDGSDVISSAVVTKDASGQMAYRFYLAAHTGARVEMFIYAATSREAYERHQPQFRSFLDSVSFASIGAQVARQPMLGPRPASTALPDTASARTAPPPSALSLEGLYTGTTTSNQFNMLTGYYDHRVYHSYYLFTADGHVYRGLPRGGRASGFEVESARRDSPENVGSYRIAGDQIQFRWPGGDQTQTFKRNANGTLQIGRTIYYHVEKAPAGLRLSGTYSAVSFVNTSTGNGARTGTVSNVAGERRITFYPDGRFSVQGVVGFAGSGPYAGAATRGETASSGTYRIYDYTLELDHADGRREQFTFFIHPQNAKEPQPGLVMVEGAGWLLRK
jgi:hypothetical protein